MNYLLLKKQKWKSLNDENATLKQVLTSASTFVEAIKQGDLKATYSEGSADSELATSLLSLRSRMAE